MRCVHQASAAIGGIHKLDLSEKFLHDAPGLGQCTNVRILDLSDAILWAEDVSALESALGRCVLLHTLNNI